jgi:hypothetical protein
MDAHDGDVSGAIKAKGSVDASTPGIYAITYSVSDLSGNFISLVRQVEVCAPPVVTCATALAQLPWSGGALGDVGLSWQAATRRPLASATCRVTQDEAITGASGQGFDAQLTFANGLPDHLSLRQARAVKGDGRVYLITITVVDDLGQLGEASCCVVVPKGGGAKNLSKVNAQAAADLAAGAPLPVDSFGMPTGNG